MDTEMGRKESLGKHAYMIMAHHRPDLLKELLAAIDDERNDVFLHIDKKSRDDMKGDDFRLQRAGLHIIPSIEVNWGGYSQIECELNLLKAAVDAGHHAYYHLLTGATYPIKSQDHIHDFFSEQKGQEFIDIDEALGRPNPYDRVRYYHIFNEAGKELSGRNLRNILRIALVGIQKAFGVDRFRKFNMELKKGLAYWSITQGLAEYVLKHRDLIEEMMSPSILGDEVFIQTLVYNSPFKEGIYSDKDGNCSSLRLSTWELEDKGLIRPGHNFISEDLDYIQNSSALFALKFEGEQGLDLIRALTEETGLN